jgi:hypothetical protein
MQNVAIVAGAAATAIGLDLTRVQDWTTRFATLFKEYAIVGARLEIRPQNIANTAGIIAAYLDEQSGAAPTAVEALHRPRLDMTAGPLFVPKAYHIDWTPLDLLDLDFVDVATTFSPVWLKIFTNVANFGTLATTTGEVLVTGTLALEFRGYQ